MKLSSAIAILLLLPASALADEYSVSSFTGGYTAPPPEATTVLSAGMDDATAGVNLPFEFAFFGRLFSRVSVCSNGWLAFGTTTDTTSTNPTLPGLAAPNGVVAPLWDDLKTGSGSVVAFTLGSAPNRTFVVSWERVDTFSATEADDMSFQVRLDEADGTIEIAYAAGGTWDGLSYTAGIEDPTGAIAFGGPNTDNANSGQPALDQRFEAAISTLFGTVLRDRPVADASGLGNSFETGLAVAGADIVVRRADDGQVAARGRTDAAGTWSATTYGMESPSTVNVVLNAAGAAARVTDATPAVYAHEIGSMLAADPTVDLGTLTLDAAIDATNPAFREALNIQQAAERGLAYAVAAAQFAADTADPPRPPETFAQLEFRFVDGLSTSSYVPQTASAAPLASISDLASNPDAYDDDVVLREYGQHVLATISTHPGTLPQRSWSAATGHTFAFADGFAHWFAAVVQERNVFIDTKTQTVALTFDLEGPDPTPDPGTDGDQVTAAIAASLWELVDPANEPEDEFAGTLGAPPSTAADVLAAIDIGLDAVGATVIAIQPFFDAWRTGGPDLDRQQTARAFIHHGTLFDDAFEPNDRRAEAGDAGPGVQRIDGLILSPFNEDHFDFVLGSTSVLTVTVQQTSDTDLDVEVLNAGGTAVAFATNLGLTEGRDVVSAVTAAEVPPGTYTARVVWRGKTFANYALSFFEPFDLLTTALPEWTVNVPFKEDLFATGGVAPYAFTTVPNTPGLSATNGTRVEGTPTTAGDFVVDVAVVDNAAPSNALQVGIPLRVNPELAVVELFAVPEESDVGFDAGTGGTAATWIPSGASPPGGLSLDGGATLRLSGTTPGPATFEIQGSATDSVGASLNTTTSRVVVTGDMVATSSAEVPEGGHFGFFFDGLEGSVTRLRFRFRGGGSDPLFRAIVDSAGNVVLAQGDSRVREPVRRVRINGFVLPATGRYHVIFDPAAFTGDVVPRSTVRPPRRGRGQVSIDTVDRIVDEQFEALAGSVLTVFLQRSPSPFDLRPRVFAIIGPDDAEVEMPPQRFLGRGRRTRLPRTRLPLDGSYTLRLSGDSSTTGPLFYRYRIVTPRGARFVAD